MLTEYQLWVDRYRTVLLQLLLVQWGLWEMAGLRRGPLKDSTEESFAVKEQRIALQLCKGLT